ncbi:hypothetical protein Plhal304r1_c001g0003241 [Plasmopara halstedii]
MDNAIPGLPAVLRNLGLPLSQLLLSASTYPFHFTFCCRLNSSIYLGLVHPSLSTSLLS